MKLKRFNEYAEQPKGTEYLPMTTSDVLTTYYHCPDCNALYNLFNEESHRCKYCGSNNVELIPKEEYYKLVRPRLEDDEWEEEMIIKKQKEEEMVDLINLGKYKQIKKLRRNIN